MGNDSFTTQTHIPQSNITKEQDSEKPTSIVSNSVGKPLHIDVND